MNNKSVSFLRDNTKTPPPIVVGEGFNHTVATRGPSFKSWISPWLSITLKQDPPPHPLPAPVSLFPCTSCIKR